MIREERDPAFWFEVASHPAVLGAVMGLSPAQVAQCSQKPEILPLASMNGGFLFCRMDQIGITVELHTLYRPAGWGKEVSSAAKEAFAWVFRTHQIVTTYELQANDRSQPPRSFGFVRCGEWQQTPAGLLRAWVLTRAAWEASPAQRRYLRCHSSRQ